jgi:hypothetical protein
VGLALSARAGAQAPAGAPPSGLGPLVEQLGDRDFRLRDDAARRLQAEGVAALPALRRALGHPDPEVRRRARDLIPAIETAALVAPRRVSLRLADKPLRAALDEVTRQTGYRIEFWSTNPAQTYSFDFRDLPFWQAIDHVCRTANLTIQQNFGDERLLLQQGQGEVPFVQYAGAFRFVPTGLQQTRYFNLGLAGKNAPVPPVSETLTLSFSVFSEPRMPILGMGEARLEAAYDTEKNSMLQPGGGPGEVLDPRFGVVRRWSASRFGNGNRSFQMQGEFHLHRPSLKATGIRVVRGSLPLTLLVEQKPVVVTDKVLSARGKKVTVGSTTFLFEDVSELPGKQYQVKLSVTEDNHDNPNDYTWMNTLYQRIELLDEKDNKFQVFSSSWGNSGANHVQMTLGYGAAGNAKMTRPAKFVFHSWKTLQHQVDFEFKDLPLP